MLDLALMVELVGGAARFKALRCLYEDRNRAFGTRELAAAASIDPSNASRWLRRWAEVGLVERKVERGVPLFAASGNPALDPLWQLMQQASRATEVLAKRLASLGDQVVAAAVFGSAAQGGAGPGSDVDVLLVTTLPQLKAQALFKPAGRALGRPVNILAYTPDAWRNAVRSGDAFVRELLAQPLISLKGRLDAAAPA